MAKWLDRLVQWRARARCIMHRLLSLIRCKITDARSYYIQLWIILFVSCAARTLVTPIFVSNKRGEFERTIHYLFNFLSLSSASIYYRSLLKSSRKFLMRGKYRQTMANIKDECLITIRHWRKHGIYAKLFEISISQPLSKKLHFQQQFTLIIVIVLSVELY